MSIPEEGWGAYHRVMFPDFESRVTSGFIRWKILSTGVDIAAGLWEARERERQAWEDEHGSDPDRWPISHPPVVLWQPHAAHAACLRCLWFDDSSGNIRVAGRLAREHAIGEGADTTAMRRWKVPVASRSGPSYSPAPRRWA